MNLTRTLEQVLRYVEPVLVAVLILRLAAQGLLLRYRAFGAYLLIWLGQDTLPLLLGLSLEGNAYARFFFISEPVAWLFLFLILYELFDLTFASFPGVRSAGKLLLTAAVLIAVLVATGTALPSLMSSHTRVGLLNFYFVIERSVMLVMLILLGALQYLMVHFRLQLPRNTVVYSTTYAIYFAMRALEILLMSELGTNTFPSQSEDPQISRQGASALRLSLRVE
jgi:hypothetical protein